MAAFSHALLIQRISSRLGAASWGRFSPGRHSPGFGRVSRFAHTLGRRVSDIIEGRGAAMCTMNAREVELLMAFRGLSVSEQRAYVVALRCRSSQ
jgi:hypothetical protein